MKRCIKWLVNKFSNWVNRMETEEKIAFSIAAILGIVTAVFLFTSADTVPANISDYEVMEEQVIAIHENPSLIFSMDCNINVNDEVITVNFENEECKLTAKYDKNDFEILSTSKSDKYCHWVIALLLSLLFSTWIYALGIFIIYLIILIIETIYEFVCEKLKSKKSKKK